jgi:Flp pilus assembly pilin Flp
MRFLSLKRMLTKRQSGRFLRNQRGVTAIEFALLGPIFGLMAFSIFETGMIIYTENTMQVAVQEAARLVRTGRAQTQHMTAAQFKKAVCFIAGRITNCDKRMTVYMKRATSFAALQASLPSYISIGTSSYAPDSNGNSRGPYDCGNPKDAVALIATYDYQIYTPIMMSNFANLNAATNTRRIIAFAMFRNEPFPLDTTTVCPISNPPAPPPAP